MTDPSLLGSLEPVPIRSLGPCRHPSPLRLASQPGEGRGRFVPDGRYVRFDVELGDEATDDDALLMEKAGPRERLFFEPSRTRAAIVTCGGLGPGLNNVIRSAFLELKLRYGVKEVLGIRQGYRGLNPDFGLEPLVLTLDAVRDVHHLGGTLLGSSRGSQPIATMVDFLQDAEVQLLLAVGGDGTQRGALALADEIARRQAAIAVVGVPKTIDNDLSFCDRTFGFVTAVEKACEAIDCAHAEAIGAPRGIGLVKLMGRHAGFIACGAALVTQEANFVLIPEVPFALEGSGGLLAALEERMDRRGHAVVIVAEGAGQDLFPASDAKDASGNPRLHDVGPFLKDRIVAFFKDRGRPVELKYIDPSYIVRSVAANADDAWLCDQLARHAVHAGMAGKTGLVVGMLHQRFVHVPIALAVERRRKVDPDGELWGAVLASTGQPARLS